MNSHEKGLISMIMNEQQQKRARELRNQMLYVITAFLQDEGYPNVAEILSEKAQLSRDIHVCDNINLETIILEYSDYYFIKYNRYPKLCKKMETAKNVTRNNGSKWERVHNPKEDDRSNEYNNTDKSKMHKPDDDRWNDLSAGIRVTPISRAESDEKSTIFNRTSTYNKKKLKPIDDLYPPGSELREIAEVISREVVQQDLNVHWDDIIGLEDCKTSLKETVIYPLKYPSLFNDKLGSCNGVLMYGPPGTGKTMLAKAVATECLSTFFNITASSLISKWRGDSEKYIRVLIDLAKHNAPSVIYIDEIDWAAATDVNFSVNSEPTRRFRSEFLVRLDGLLSNEYKHVILLAASNVPWNIDIALLRRLEKKIFVKLPDENDRKKILQSYVLKELHETEEMRNFVMNTDGFSCADLIMLCKEAKMSLLRPYWQTLEEKMMSVNDIPFKSFIYSIRALETAKHRFALPITDITYEKYFVWHKNSYDTCLRRNYDDYEGNKLHKSDLRK